MTEIEVPQAIKTLKGMFTKTTQEQIDYWTFQFLKYPLYVVQEVIEREVEKPHTGSIEVFALKRALDTYSNSDPAQRRLKEASISQSRAEQFKRESGEFSDRWAAVDRNFAGMTDEDIADWKRQTLQEPCTYRVNGDIRKLNDDAIKMLAEEDPRRSRALRILMIACMNRYRNGGDRQATRSIAAAQSLDFDDELSSSDAR